MRNEDVSDDELAEVFLARFALLWGGNMTLISSLVGLGSLLCGMREC